MCSRSHVGSRGKESESERGGFSSERRNENGFWCAWLFYVCNGSCATSVCLSYGRASYSHYITTVRLYVVGLKFKYCSKSSFFFSLVKYACVCMHGFFVCYFILLWFFLYSLSFFCFKYVKCDVAVSWLCVVRILFKFWTYITISHAFFSICHKWYK